MAQPFVIRKLAKALGPLALLAMILSGCGVPDRSAPLSAAAPTAVLPTRAAPQPGDRLYIRDGFKGDAERLTIIDSNSGARERDLPPGVIAPDWSTIYVAEQTGGKTIVRALDVETGRILHETTLDGAYALPMITPDSVMGGLSPDGRWLALTARPAQLGTKKTQFVVLDTGFKEKPRQASLDGDFYFDGLNNSGSWLFLTEGLADDPTAKYQVRRYDLAKGALDPNVIVDKLEGSKIMSGRRQTAAASKQGDWLYSLYLNPSHGPFIHALPIANNDGIAFCIDLPSNSKEDPAKQSRWSLVMSADKRTLYAVNGALGVVVEYDVNDGFPQVVRTKALLDMPIGTSGAAAANPITSAVTALSPDGKTLFTPGEQGLLVIDTKAVTLRGRYLPDWTLDGVVISPDGARLYAASAAQGKIVRLDPSTGTIAAEVLAAGQPSGVVRVEAHK
jgi:hypothetical protein